MLGDLWAEDPVTVNRVENYLKQFKKNNGIQLLGIPCNCSVKGSQKIKARTYINLVYQPKGDRFKMGLFLDLKGETFIIDIPQDSCKQLLRTREDIKPIQTKTLQRDAISKDEIWCKILEYHKGDGLTIEDAIKKAINELE